MNRVKDGTGFMGPLFVVGLSRSGTKMLKGLLNQHSMINLTPVESHFIPMLVGKYGKRPVFDTSEKQMGLARDIHRTVFVAKMKELSIDFDLDAFIQATDFSSWSTILESLFRMMADEPGRQDTIWGDKTPGYLMHVQLLKGLVPQARFIHIIRDVRDRVLSVHHMWGKSRVRASAQWAEQIGFSLQYREQYGGDYIETRYEDLLQDPDAELSRLCSFLGVSYEPEMKQLKRSPERFGDARGRLEIMRSNTGKYRTRMSRNLMKKVERPAYNMMRLFGYEPLQATGYRPLHPFHLWLLVAYDRMAHIWFKIRRVGLVRGVKQAIQTYREDFPQQGTFPGED